MEDKTKTDLGEIKIHRNVISSIAIEATKQIPGVGGIGTNLRSHFMELLGKKDTSTIKIDFDKEGTATISIPIIVKYGYNIPDVASKVQDNIKASIENATNIDIKDINIIIQEIEKKSEGVL